MKHENPLPLGEGPPVLYCPLSGQPEVESFPESATSAQKAPCLLKGNQTEYVSWPIYVENV